MPNPVTPTTDAQDLPTKWALPGLVLLCGVLFFYKLGGYALFDIDEPRYAEAAREMIESGNWVTPYFNYVVRLEKPVLFYWLAAISYKIFGVSEFAARLVSAVMATVMVLGTFRFGRHFVSVRYGLYAALILATSIMVAGLARMSITDMTLATFMTLTTFSLFLALHRDIRYWFWAGVFAGLAILTKGPVGIVLPGAVLMVYALVTGQFKKAFLNKWFPVGLAMAAAVALPWYWVAYQENGQFFLDSLVFNNVDRFNSVVTGHDQDRFQFGPINVFFFVVLVAGFMPWSVYLPVAVSRWATDVKAFHKKFLAEDNRFYQVTLYAAIWVLLILSFFSFSKTKLLTYILPLFPALSLWLAAMFYRAREEGSLQGFAKTAWVLFGALVIAGVAAFAVLDKIVALVPTEAQTLVTSNANILAVVVLTLGVGTVALLLTKNKMTQALIAQALTLSFTGVIAVHHIVPAVNNVMQGDMLSFAKTVGDKPLALYEIQRPSLTFYTRQRVPHIKREEYDQLYRLLAENEKKTGERVLYVVTKNKYLNQLAKLEPRKATVRLVENGPVYSLLAVEKTAP